MEGGGGGCDCDCLLGTDVIDGGDGVGGDGMVHWNSSDAASLVDVGDDRDHGDRGHDDAHGHELADDDAGGDGADDHGAHVCSCNVTSAAVDVAAAVGGGGGVALSRAHDGSELQCHSTVAVAAADVDGADVGGADVVDACGEKTTMDGLLGSAFQCGAANGRQTTAVE